MSRERKYQARLAGWLFGLLFAVCGFTWFSCSALEEFAGGQLEDIEGWDMSACVESSCGRETCLELFLDNDTSILGGQTAIEALFDVLFPSEDVDTNGDAGTNGE